MYDNDKDTVIRVRVPQRLKDDFQMSCKHKAINSSELLRQLITQWIHEQQDVTIIHKLSSEI